jgi:hypothetical protein
MTGKRLPKGDEYGFSPLARCASACAAIKGELEGILSKFLTQLGLYFSIMNQITYQMYFESQNFFK